MTLLVSNSGQRVKGAEKLPHRLGDFTTPRSWAPLGKTPLWAADNDAFAKFDPDRFRWMLDRIVAGLEGRAGVHPPVFVTVPDVVGDHRATMERWNEWSEEVRDRGLPAAFVLQNGIEYGWDYYGTSILPWEDIDALFIGGDNAFKFSEHTRDIVRVANLHSKWVHMGRVNSVRRMEYANQIGCDSCDGSGMARFPSSHLVPMLKALSQEQLFLFN